jgi:hypothetical protein
MAHTVARRCSACVLMNVMPIMRNYLTKKNGQFLGLTNLLILGSSVT